MSSKYQYESDLIKLARDEYEKNGRSDTFLNIEDDIILNSDFRNICEFAFTCKGADVERIERAIEHYRGDEYVGGFYFLAKYVKGTNHRLLEQKFLDYANGLNVITYDVVMAGVNFAINFKNSRVNEFFKVVVKSSLPPVDKVLIAIQFAHMFSSIDVWFFKHFISWCKCQNGDDLYKAYIKKLSLMVSNRAKEQKQGVEH